MKNQYSESQLLQLVQDVEREFSAHLAKAEEEKSIPVVAEPAEPVLAKAEDEKKPEEKKPEGEEKKPEGESKPEGKPEGEEKKPEGESKPEEKQPEGEPKLEGKPEGEAKPEGDLGHDYDDEDMQHMRKMYASMSKGELKAHHDCIAELAKCGQMEQPVMKSEEIKPVEVEVKIDDSAAKEVEMLKSELSATNSKYDELKKNFDAVTAFLTKLVEKKVAPAPKAITSLDVITKSEGAVEEAELSKSEILDRLKHKTQDPTLKKADRDLINDFYLNGGSVKSITHLLK